MNPLLLRLLLGISMLALSCAASHAMEPEDVPYAFLEQAAPLGVEHTTNYLQLLPAELRQYLIQLMTVSKTPYELGQNLRGIILTSEFAQYLPIFIGLQKNEIAKALFIVGLDIPEITEILIQEIMQSEATKKALTEWIIWKLTGWAIKEEHLPMQLGEFILFNFLITPRQLNGKLEPIVNLLDIFKTDRGQFIISSAAENGKIAFLQFILNHTEIDIEKALGNALGHINNHSLDVIKFLMHYLSINPYKTKIIFERGTQWGSLIFYILRNTQPISLNILHFLLDENLTNPVIFIDLEYLLSLARFLLSKDPSPLIKTKLNLITEYLDKN